MCIRDSYKSSFYVASNAAFDIYAEADATPTATDDWAALTGAEALTNDKISYSFAPAVAGGAAETGTQGTVNYGANAQDPSAATQPTLTTLADIDTGPTQVFAGAQRTASARGSLASQSVRFDAEYALDQGYDLSLGVGTVTTNVTYTVYVP